MHEKIRQEVARLAEKHNIDTTLYQELDSLKIYGDINEIVLVDDGHGVDIEVFINGEITENSYIENDTEWNDH